MRINVSDGFLILTLLFPLGLAIATLQGIGFEINIFYFVALAIMAAAIYLDSLLKVRQNRQEFFVRILLIVVVIFCLALITQVRYTMPVVFFVVLLIFFCLPITDYAAVNKKRILAFCALYLFISLTFLVHPSSFGDDGRFDGFTGSSTTYSIYITVFVILALAQDISVRLKVLAYLIGLFLVYITLTRLNLAFYLVVPFLYYFSKRGSKLKIVLLFGFMLILNAAYPIYDFVIKKHPEVIEFRYSSGRDASFNLRYSLNNTIARALKESSTTEIFFGHGVEASRLLIKRRFGLDLLPHNDFIRILYDFGILGVFLFFVVFMIVAMKNEITYMLGFVYLLSFYHNMIYNFFVIALMILFYKYNRPVEIIAEKKTIATG